MEAMDKIRGDHTGTIHARARNLAKMLPMLDSNERARLKRLPPQAVTVNGLRLVEMVKQAATRTKKRGGDPWKRYRRCL